MSDNAELTLKLHNQIVEGTCFEVVGAVQLRLTKREWEPCLN